MPRSKSTADLAKDAKRYDAKMAKATVNKTSDIERAVNRFAKCINLLRKGYPEAKAIGSIDEYVSYMHKAVVSSTMSTRYNNEFVVFDVAGMTGHSNLGLCAIRHTLDVLLAILKGLMDIHDPVAVRDAMGSITEKGFEEFTVRFEPAIVLNE